MRRSLAVLTLIVLTGCASPTAPKNFLPTATRSSHAWLNEFVEVDLHNVALADLPKRGAFRGLNLLFGDVDGNAFVSLEATHVTRRYALWQLADKYGLTMTLVQNAEAEPTILIANRQSRRENKPVQ